MAKSNKDILTQDDSIEKRVDAMMDPRAETAAPQPKVMPETPESALPPIDIFAEPTSAPPLPGDAILKEEVEPTLEIIEEPVASATLERSAESVEEEVEVKPLAIDTPQSDSAIDDIVAQEADAVLAAEDAHLATEADNAEAAQPEEPAKHGHPIFWFVIAILVILAFVAGYMLTNPNFELPFSA